MSEPRISHYDAIPSIDRGSGVRTVPLVTAETGVPNLRVGTTRFTPGTAIPPHTHNCDEVIVLLEGAGIAIVGGVEHAVRPYDTVFVPAGVVHCFQNTGPAPVAILWIYPTDRVTRTLAATGETFEHLSEQDRVARPTP
ncbi:MAG: cupin domain-containing protein [Chloroflexi bacterium]|nr:cupin domain-containing protein [Chloroflexota bacterium]